MSPTNRRGFLYTSALAAAGTLAANRLGLAQENNRALPKVVHVHHGRAATWPKSSGKYRDYVDATAVALMLDEAVIALTGTNSASAAWSQIFALPDNANRKLTIKCNLNNADDPNEGAKDNVIDAIPEPAMAVVRGFLMAGGQEANINIFDGTDTWNRFFAPWFRDRVHALYPNVKFNAYWQVPAPVYVEWSAGLPNPASLPKTTIKGGVLKADYVVNIPIVKRHCQAGVTLGYKNHFGSISKCDALHSWVYNPTPGASVLADIMASPTNNPNYKPLYKKTALVVGDLLLGQPCSNFGQRPRPWKLFRNEWPNGLIVSTDPVAADSVMCDVLKAEPATEGGCGSIWSGSRDYLTVAEQRGQGVHDKVDLPVNRPFDPVNMTYTKIQYRHIDLWPSGALLNVQKSGGQVLLTWQHYFPGPCDVYRATRPDFSDASFIGRKSDGQLVDILPGSPAFYRVLYAG